MANLVLSRLPLTHPSSTQIMDDLIRRAQCSTTIRKTTHCSGCLDLDPALFDQIGPIWAGCAELDPQMIIHGSQNQCMPCTMIKEALHSVGLDLDMTHNKENLSLQLFDARQDGGLLAIARSREECKDVEFFTLFEGSSSPWSMIRPKTHLSGNTALKFSSRHIQRWMNDCILGHRLCPKQSDEALPTRVLDLGDSNGSIKLMESHGLSGSYICLSHSWGGYSTILCTKETYGGYRENIPWDTLPLLFQDTVKVCRMLGVRYLWIDKLCIIQHDSDDWAREGSKMAQVFEGSLLTIGAAISKGDTDSLFFQDKERAASLRKHVGQMDDGSSYTIYSRLPHRYHPTDGSGLRNFSRDYPLMSRAWVYQERLLALRTLYFGEELTWECRQASFCECSGARLGTKFCHSSSLLPKCSKEGLYRQWQLIIQDFTCLQLSHQEDRLPAISGLAQQYQTRLKSAYLAGLWKDNIVADMLWSCDPEDGIEKERYPTRKPKKWRAPSWSWASVEGPIVFNSHYAIPMSKMDTKNITFEVEIMSAECTPSSLDPTGTIATGSLVIRGRGHLALLKHAEVCTGHDTRHFSVTRTGLDSLSVESNFTVDGKEANVDYDLIERGLMKANTSMSIYCLYIGGISLTEDVFVHFPRDPTPISFFRMWRLLLHRVDGNTFERVGIIMSDHSDGDETKIQNGLEDCMITII